MHNSKKIALIACAVAAIGCFLPWATVQFGLGSVSVNGIDGDGMLVFILILFAVLAIRYGKKVLLILAPLAALLSAIISINDMMEVVTKNDVEGAIISVGTGLYMCVIGSIVAVIAAVSYLRQYRASNIAESKQVEIDAPYAAS